MRDKTSFANKANCAEFSVFADRVQIAAKASPRIAEIRLRFASETMKTGTASLERLAG